MVSVKKQYFWSLSVTSVTLRSESTMRTWAMGFVGDLENVIMCSMYTRVKCYFTVYKRTSILL